MNYSLIYVNGDSYSIPRSWTAYPDHVSAALGGVPVVNKSAAGSCNRRIVRTTCRDILRLRSQYPGRILALVGYTFLHRTELWDKELSDHTKWPDDGDFFSLCAMTEWDWFNKKDQMYNFQDRLDLFNKTSVLWYDEEAQWTNLMLDTLLLSKFLRTQDCDYVIFSAANHRKDPELQIGEDIEPQGPFIDDFKQQLGSDPGIIDLYGFSFVKYCWDHGHRPFDYDLYGKHGHPDQAGHRDFAEFLIQQIKNINNEHS